MRSIAKKQSVVGAPRFELALNLRDWSASAGSKEEVLRLVGVRKHFLNNVASDGDRALASYLLKDTFSESAGVWCALLLRPNVFC